MFSLPNETLQWLFYSHIGKGSEYRPDFVIRNVTMKDNTKRVNIRSYHLLRLTCIQQAEVTDITIMNNKCGALWLHDSTVVLRGRNILSNNSAVKGGGIALYGKSYIIMENGSRLEIINNTADELGGGVFAALQYPPTLYSKQLNICFIQIFGERATIHLEGNKAGFTGSDLYHRILQQSWWSIHITATRNCKFIDALSTNLSGCGQTQVSSDAVRLTFCRNHCIDSRTTEKILTVYPGTRFNVSFAAIGIYNDMTRASVRLHYAEVFLYEQKDLSDFAYCTCTDLIRDIRPKRTNTSGNVTLTISDYTDQHPPQILITIMVYVLPCPAGFMFSEKTCVCAESINDYAECEVQNQTITRRNSSWISPANDSIMIFDYCPFDYCNVKEFYANNPDGQCDHNRSGILCGDCIQGYSLSLGSNQCLNCTNKTWNTYAIVLGSALAGIGLVALLITLNLTVSVGTINGLLFFVNVVKIYESVFIAKNESKLLEYVFAWLNFDLGMTTCFFEGLDECQKVGLHFAFPLYLLFLVLLIVGVCRCGEWVGLRTIPWVVGLSDKAARWMGSKIISVLATLILFSYTKLVRAIILISLKADIQVFQSHLSTSNSYITTRWYVNGSLEYLTGCHFLLFGLTMGIVVPFAFLFTMFLMFFPLMERYLSHFRFWITWHMRLKPWYDAYGGPYKDRYRWWTGFLLLLRCLLVLIVTFLNNQNLALSILGWLSLLLTIFASLLHVYKSFPMNFLEACFLSLTALLGFSSSIWQTTAALALSTLLFAVILLFHLSERLKTTSLVMFVRKLKDRKRKLNADERENSIDREDEPINRSNVPISIISVASIDELREPLLEDIEPNDSW